MAGTSDISVLFLYKSQVEGVTDRTGISQIKTGFVSVHSGLVYWIKLSPQPIELGSEISRMHLCQSSGKIYVMSCDFFFFRGGEGYHANNTSPDFQEFVIHLIYTIYTFIYWYTDFLIAYQ